MMRNFHSSYLVPVQSPILRHKVLGHLELNTAIGIIQNCKRHLRKVFLTHASKGVTMDKTKAIEQIRQSIPEYIECEFVKDNTEYNISEIPFFSAVETRQLPASVVEPVFTPVAYG